MTLECLSLETDSVDNRLESHNFPGLKIIEIFMGKAVVSFSWLSPFVSAHPNLIGFFLAEIDQEFSAHNAPPFLSSLVEETQRQGLQQSHRISSVGFLRAKPINESSQEPEWCAIELELTINHSLTEVLTLFASSFPKLETLTLEFELVNERIHIVCHLIRLLTRTDVLWFRTNSLRHLPGSHLLELCTSSTPVLIWAQTPKWNYRRLNELVL
ncbi:hypothetical protein F5880DRAFT_1572502 [Lentinula raphanica]|nr:hypothetical protein F5880DRAFT_1572502 [Lentinula raphanica]